MHLKCNQSTTKPLKLNFSNTQEELGHVDLLVYTWKWCVHVFVGALTFGSPFSAMALSHWMTLSVCLKWRPVAWKTNTTTKDNHCLSVPKGLLCSCCWLILCKGWVTHETLKHSQFPQISFHDRFNPWNKDNKRLLLQGYLA